MPIQRYSLEETMEDAITNIENAIQTSEPNEVIETSPAEKLPKPEHQEEMPSNKLLKLRKKIVKPTENLNLRNVALTDENLEKLESIKKYLNKTRDKQKKEIFVSVADLLGIAVMEFLEKYHKS